MRIELTFTNQGRESITEKRTVYIAIDDTKGENHMRRILPKVDFTKLEPGETVKFQETLLAPAFAPGDYNISLWIPSEDPALKFDSHHNMLLSSKEVLDSATGLNHIGNVTVEPSRGRKSSAAPH